LFAIDGSIGVERTTLGVHGDRINIPPMCRGETPKRPVRPDHVTVLPPSHVSTPKKHVRADSLDSLYKFMQSNSLVKTLDTAPNLGADRTSVNHSLPRRQVPKFHSHAIL
jgi:hypothetical protein